MIYVFDACTIIAFLRGEPGAAEVQLVLRDADNLCFAHALNVCEVYYDFFRADGVERAGNILQDLEAVGVTVRQDMDTRLWQRAGAYKANLRRISLADCFAIALTARLDGTLLTADHHEFDPIAARGICKVRFFR